MQAFTDISHHPTVAFGNTENGCFWILQGVDNQYSNFYQILSDSTGKEKDSESGFYYFGARYYDCDLSGLFLSVDPMSDKYPEISSYHYCHWNPIKSIDPNGNDEWEINQYGRIVNRIKTTEHDAFYLVDKNGNRMMDDNYSVLYKSISFEYGAVKEMNSNNYTPHQMGFEIKDNSLGTDLFKFFADNTTVEYGLVTTKGAGAYITTDYRESSVGGSILASWLDKKGTTILSVTHNHPGGSKPSGFEKNDTHGDRFSALNFMISHGQRVHYFVYTKQDHKFTHYDGIKIYDKYNIIDFKKKCN